MKTPIFDWENASQAFIDAFEQNTNETFRNLDRDNDLRAILTADIARAQRMAAAGLRHLAVILGANKNRGKRDRWHRDALAPDYFGKIDTVAQIRSVHRRLERAHRRLRDDRLTIRIRPQSDATRDTTCGNNMGGFLSPKRFSLFPEYALKSREVRASVIVHELLHEWLVDEKIGDETVRGDSMARRLASRDREKARRNPENFEHFILEVWKDEGLEVPSGARKRDRSFGIDSRAPGDATGTLVDRPVLTPATMGGRNDLAFVALRAASDESLIPAIFEYDADPIARRAEDAATGRISYAPACCTLPDGTVITAVRAEGDKCLRLIAWDVENERSERIADSGKIYGDVYSQPDIIALGGGRLCVCFKGKTGKMKVDLVEFGRGSGFRRFANAETSGPIADHGRVCLVGPVERNYGKARNTAPDEVLLATAFRTREGKLSMDLWTGDFARRRVQREGGLLDQEITGRPGITALALRDRTVVVTAVRDEASGRLRLTAFDVGDRTRPRRMGDTGNVGARMTHSPDIVTVMEENTQQVATAIRYSVNGRIIVNTWSVPDDDVGFVRERDSSATRMPVIASTPSLMAVEGRQSEALLTSAISDSQRLSLILWSEPRRTNG